MYRTILLLPPRAALLQCCWGSFLFFACGELPAKDLFKVAWVLRQSTGSCLYRIHIWRLCVFRCQNVRCNVLLVWCDSLNFTQMRQWYEWSRFPFLDVLIWSSSFIQKCVIHFFRYHTLRCRSEIFIQIPHVISLSSSVPSGWTFIGCTLQCSSFANDVAMHDREISRFSLRGESITLTPWIHRIASLFVSWRPLSVYLLWVKITSHLVRHRGGCSSWQILIISS